MKSGRTEYKVIEVRCPCCGVLLKVDAALGQVISHEPPARSAESRDLQQAAQLLEKEKVRRETLFQKSAEAEKSKPGLLERKFEEALRKSKVEPVTPPWRDLDLD